MTGPKAHGFLFKAAMILAILDRSKTQTRRAVTMHNSLIDGTGKGIREHWKYLDWSDAWIDRAYLPPYAYPGAYWHVYCTSPGCRETKAGQYIPEGFARREGIWHRVYPRVQEGHAIYARETWALGGDYANAKIDRVPASERSPEFIRYRASQEPGLYTGRWRSPLHLPRWAARIVLPVTKVKAEWVQNISEADAKAEGCIYSADPRIPNHGNEYRRQFWTLWDSINGARPGLTWADSPPVWVYEWEPPA